VPHDKRKLVSFYWAFKEYGQRALSTEEAWGALATVRLSLLEKYKGGLSRFTREFLDRQFFNKAGGNDFETTGMLLPECMSAPAGNRLTLNAGLWCFVADEPALKDFFMIKGHAGLLPCILLFQCSPASPVRPDRPCGVHQHRVYGLDGDEKAHGRVYTRIVFAPRRATRPSRARRLQGARARVWYELFRI
jgi:hypothetical protein